MTITEIKTGRALALLLAGLLATAGAMAEQPEWAGGGKHGKSEQYDKQGRPGPSASTETRGRPDQVGDGRRENSAQGPQSPRGAGRWALSR